MSMSDPISDLMTRIRNALRQRHAEVRVPASNFKKNVLDLMRDEGYILDCRLEGAGPKKDLVVSLKYHGENEPVIQGLKRVSKPGRRLYFTSAAIPKVMSGYGIMVLSTSHGLMSDREARRRNLGGEAVLSIW